MQDSFLLHHLIARSAERRPASPAVTAGPDTLTYEALALAVERFRSGLIDAGLQRGDRVAVYLDKRPETVIACFGSAAAGAAFVPINPLLRAPQVGYILRDCNVRLLVTSRDRLDALAAELAQCPDLAHLVSVGESTDGSDAAGRVPRRWTDLLAGAGTRPGFRTVDGDMAAILYTSGSTGQPKGVVLSHRNLVAGARSVADYLENVASDVLAAALPLSFDAGFSQLTTAFHAGARVVLVNYVFPRDLLKVMAAERVTGLTAVPPLWIQLAQAEWPAAVTQDLRYFANTGGHMPRELLKALRARAPQARPYLMYGLTEAFRATYLPPEQADVRPDSIGKAIPNAEILVLREDGTPCGPNEPGELVQRGAHVALGYWNDPERTAERFRVLPRRAGGIVLPEIAVFSGDTVRTDEEGYLYFIGRRDEMIKTSGYRVSPNEVEEVVFGVESVRECAAFGIADAALGQRIVVVVQSDGDDIEVAAAVVARCKERLPLYMLPAQVLVRTEALPRNPNGKIDRKRLATEFAQAQP
jgi:acyl-CoA ligase (AMP-forming) (exosortase A-associated)